MGWNGDGPGYGSPILADFGGTRQVIVFSQQNLVGVDAANGQLLWKVPFAARSITNSITPLVYGQTVIVSGQGKPLTAYTISKRDDQWTAEMAWENDQLQMSFSNPVLVRTRCSRCRRSTAASSSGPMPRPARRSGARRRVRRATPRSSGRPTICSS